MKRMKAWTFLSLFCCLTLIDEVMCEPGPAPDPDPVADPGRKQGVPRPPVVAEQPKDLIAVRNSPARFYCRAEGYPYPTISWLKDGVELRDAGSGSRIMMPSGEIVFYRVRSHGDEGVYQCVAHNSLGEARSRNATLRIAYIKDDFRTIPKDDVVAVRKEAFIECQGPRGLPEPTISWIKDEKEEVVEDGRIRVVDGSLVISDAHMSDSGTYQCKATNIAGSRTSIAVLLGVQDPPQFTIRPIDETVVVGQDVELTCEARGSPKPRIRWTKQDGVIQGPRIVPLSNGNLRIINIQPDDEGLYLCIAENHVAQEVVDAYIRVQIKPGFIRFPEDVSTRVGSSVTLPCSAIGNPKPAILWHAVKGPNMFPDNSYYDGHFVVNSDGDLTIHNVQFSDKGDYSCQALSPVGQVTVLATLTVLSRESNVSPPIIRQGPSNQTVVQGDSVELRCTTSTVPVPEFQWKKEGYGQLLSDNRYTVTKSGSLKLKEAQNSDAGRYTCTAANDYGHSTWDAWIKVIGKKSTITQPNDEIHQLPSPPSTPTLVNNTATTLTIHWRQHNYTGTSAVIGYILEYYRPSSNSATWNRVKENITDTLYTLRGLVPSSSYVFLVRTQNSYGISDPSGPSEQFRTRGLGSSQGKLDQVSVNFVTANPLPLSTSGGGILLSWKSFANCDTVDGFRIFVQTVSIVGGKPVSYIAACYERTTELVNLRARTIYEIRIRPYKAESMGNASPIVLASLESEGTQPASPILTSTINEEDGASASTTFRWTPVVSILPEYITQYTLRCREKTDGYDKTLRLGSNITQVTLDDLPRGREYEASLTFSTQLGDGRESNTVVFTISAASPSNGDFMSTIQKNPGLLAGIAAAMVAIIAVIVGILLYRRHNGNKKSRGLHGRSGNALDPYSNADYTKGFAMIPTGSGYNNCESEPSKNGDTKQNNLFFQQQSMQGGMTIPPAVARNTTVSINNSNGNVGTSLSQGMADMRRSTPRQTSSFSYVTDQLTSMSSIPPQFSSPNLARTPTHVMANTELEHQFQQKQQQYRQNDDSTISSEEYQRKLSHRDITNDIHEGYSMSIRDLDLPPPPPSPPMSDMTSVNDITNRSRKNSKNSADRSSTGRSRRPRAQSRLHIQGRIATDTDTGIYSPQQTPSPPRHADFCLDSLTSPPIPPTRGVTAFPYQQALEQHYSRHVYDRRNDGIALEYNPGTADPNVSYLSGSSEGENEFELNSIRRISTKQYATMPEETRNSVTVSSVSMMNAYGSEPDCESSCERRTSQSTSSIESLNMESVSQVGVDEPPQMLSPRSVRSAFVSVQSQVYDKYSADALTPSRSSMVKPRVIHKHLHSVEYPEIVGHYQPPDGKPYHATPVHILNRVNSASSSGSSSYPQNTADSGMSAGPGSFGHNSFNSSSSAESNFKGQISRSKTTGSLSTDHSRDAISDDVLNGHGQVPNMDRRYLRTLEPAYCQSNHGRPTPPQPHRAPRMGTGGTPVARSPQIMNSKDLSLPQRDSMAYEDCHRNSDASQSMLPEDDEPADCRTNEEELPQDSTDDSRIAFLAAKYVFGGGAVGKSGRVRPPELSDVPEVSTSDFCEDYSDHSQ